MALATLSQGQRKRLALLTAFLEDRPIYAADQDHHYREIFYSRLGNECHPTVWLRAAVDMPSSVVRRGSCDDAKTASTASGSVEPEDRIILSPSITHAGLYGLSS